MLNHQGYVLVPSKPEKKKSTNIQPLKWIQFIITPFLHLLMVGYWPLVETKVSCGSEVEQLSPNNGIGGSIPS